MGQISYNTATKVIKSEESRMALHFGPIAQLLCWTVVTILVDRTVANSDARRLYDFLLAKGRYSKLVRPVEFNEDKVDVNMGLKLSQLINVDEKNQIITMNMFLTQRWADAGLRWDPEQFGGVETLNIPSEKIWLPDIVLYNNGDGDYNVTALTHATVNYTGMVFWEPPVIIKSYCDINVKYFPFDEQTCHLKFGTWSYNYDSIDLNHIWASHYGEEKTVPIEVGINTEEYYPHVGWDLMSVPAQKHIVEYPCCPGVFFPDISFNFTLRRKTRHYTINLIMPTVFINFLTVLGFYLPSDCGEKISLSISILLSLSIFQLLLMDLIPETSVTLPLMGAYLLCTLFLVTLSVFFSVIVLRANCQSSAIINMPYCVKRIFLEILPPILLMRRPKQDKDPDEKGEVDWSSTDYHSDLSNYGNPYKKKLRPINESTTANSSSNSQPYMVTSAFIGLDPTSLDLTRICEACVERNNKVYGTSAQKAREGVSFIAKHLYDDDTSRRAKDEWKFLALVADRILLLIYTTVTLVGGLKMMLSAPVLYDHSEPLNAAPPPVPDDFFGY